MLISNDTVVQDEKDEEGEEEGEGEEEEEDDEVDLDDVAYHNGPRKKQDTGDRITKDPKKKVRLMN